MTSQAIKNIKDIKYMRANSVGRLSIASYIKNTQPSCDPASYTVKKLVAAMQNKLGRTVLDT